jgi:glycosyltransferase involved in cell wall biosynthesis
MALALLEGNAELRRILGRSGRRYFETHYAWDVIERKYLDLLARVAGAQ